MAFDDLTSERARQLLQALLLEMDPDRYASFMALGLRAPIFWSFGTWA
jgi:hypothetical protein